MIHSYPGTKQSLNACGKICSLKVFTFNIFHIQRNNGYHSKIMQNVMPFHEQTRKENLVDALPYPSEGFLIQFSFIWWQTIVMSK